MPPALRRTPIEHSAVVSLDGVTEVCSLRGELYLERSQIVEVQYEVIFVHLAELYKTYHEL
jgi:hypothetical protein